MQPGVYDNLSNADYHGGPGISKSGLDLIARSPMHFKAKRDSANDNVPTPAQAIGTAFHAITLEPQVFTSEYTLALRRSDVPDAIDERETLVAMVQEINKGRLAKLPTSGSKSEQLARILSAYDECDAAKIDVVRYGLGDLEHKSSAELKAELARLNESRPGLLPTAGNRHELAQLLRDHGRPVTLWSDTMEEWQRNNGHRQVLAGDAWEQVHAMRNSVMDHPAASRLLSAPGRAELSVYWRDPVTGVLCRCRPDFWRDDGIVVDLKSTEDASPEGFAKSIANWRYDVQAPYYVDGINLMREQAGRSDIAKAKAFVFIAVEKKAPYAVGVYLLDAESIEHGRVKYRACLDTFAACDTSGVFPGYGDKIQTISLPGWQLAKAA